MLIGDELSIHKAVYELYLEVGFKTNILFQRVLLNLLISKMNIIKFFAVGYDI